MGFNSGFKGLIYSYIERQSGGHGIAELESAYNAAIVGLSEYSQQGKDRLTRLVPEYDAGKTKY